MGWSYLSAGEAVRLRKGEGGVLLYSELQSKLIDLNPGVIDAESALEVVSRLESVRNNIEGNSEILAWLRGERTVRVAAQNMHRNVSVVDFGRVASNTFQVTDEWKYSNGRFANKADVMFLINGIPVALVETKAAHKRDAIEIGLVQVRRYHAETPEMLTHPQVFDLTHVIDFYYGATWSLDSKSLYNWKDEEAGNFERKVKRFFSRERFLKLLQHWIVFFKKHDELRKVVLRQHQTRTVEKVLDRALDAEKRRGLVWHTQGSGKTFTMIKAAELILDLRTGIPGATVLMLVDRDELEGQLTGWIENVLGPGRAEVARNKRHLRELLAGDFRGLIISMIHKFEDADKNLCTRDNIFVFVDEAHRTTGGDLGNFLEAAIPKATMIGFTGTPIDRIAHGKGTFKVFGRDDPQGYLDKYSIAESVADGTTLELHYTLAPSTMRVDAEVLEREFLALPEAQGVSDVEDLNRVLDRAVKLKNFLKGKARIETVAGFVARHFKETVAPLGYKAFLVAVDREACALYKKALDRHFKHEESEVVYSPAHNDSGLIAELQINAETEKQVRRNFAKPGLDPKILIVTEKLLTGFDAPILYCMYLDKPMRDHTLLQAIARVNRPYEDAEGRKKPAGLVVDFIGIFEKLEKALAFDSDVVETVVHDLDVLKKRFHTLLTKDAKPILEICRGARDDKAVEAIVDAFADQIRRDAFYKLFKEIERLYEIISPDAALRDHLADYRDLSYAFQVVCQAYNRRAPTILDLAKKTELLVREHVTNYGLEATLPAVKLNAAALAALKEDEDATPSRIMNLLRSLGEAARESDQPVLVPIGLRAEMILDAYDGTQEGTRDALAKLRELLGEYLEAKQLQSKTGLDPRTFAVYWIIKREGVTAPDAVARKIVAAVDRHANYPHHAGALREVKAELYALLLPLVGKDRMKEIVEVLLQVRA